MAILSEFRLAIRSPPVLANARLISSFRRLAREVSREPKADRLAANRSTLHARELFGQIVIVAQSFHARWLRRTTTKTSPQYFYGDSFPNGNASVNIRNRKREIASVSQEICECSLGEQNVVSIAGSFDFFVRCNRPV